MLGREMLLIRGGVCFVIGIRGCRERGFGN